MRPDRDADVLQDVVVLLDGRMVDMHARIVDDLVDDPVRIGLRRPAEVVDRLRPVALPAGIDFVNRANLARFRVSDQVLVLEAPPRRRVAAERLAGISRIGRRPWLHIHDADFEDVARLGAADIDRTGADVHAKALARAAPEQLAVDRPRAAAIDVFLVLGPQEHALGARIALDHALGVVIGVVRQGLDGDVIARIHFKLRLQELAEIAPMYGVGVRRQFRTFSDSLYARARLNGNLELSRRIISFVTHDEQKSLRCMRSYGCVRVSLPLRADDRVGHAATFPVFGGWF